MAFLERNLEQLTHVQRQLVEQNSGLKKEVAIAERKLIARNERIQSLESLLQDSQEKLTAANHRYAVAPPLCIHKASPLTIPAVSRRSLLPSRTDWKLRRLAPKGLADPLSSASRVAELPSHYEEEAAAPQPPEAMRRRSPSCQGPWAARRSRRASRTRGVRGFLTGVGRAICHCYFSTFFSWSVFGSWLVWLVGWMAVGHRRATAVAGE